MHDQKSLPIGAAMVWHLVNDLQQQGAPAELRRAIRANRRRLGALTRFQLRALFALALAGGEVGAFVEVCLADQKPNMNADEALVFPLLNDNPGRTALLTEAGAEFHALVERLGARLTDHAQKALDHLAP